MIVMVGGKEWASYSSRSGLAEYVSQGLSLIINDEGRNILGLFCRCRLTFSFIDILFLLEHVAGW